MKKVFLLIVLCITAMLLLFVGCDKGCKIKYPKDVKSIDWGNYNDIYTIYWNCYSCCDEIKSEYEGKAIKISGWKAWSYDLFYLCDDAKYAIKSFENIAATPIINIKFNFTEASSFLDTCDVTKKWFMKGKIRLTMEKYSNGCYVEPVIEIMDINDIHFK